MIKQLLRSVRQSGRRLVADWRLPPAAKRERRRDALGLPAEDVGLERAVAEAAAWLGRAQDHSRSADGGVARHYSLVDGWSTSYPETTGYVVPTMLALGERERARRMLDWLVSIQFPEGGFQGGLIDSTPRVPVTFNTGQILLGLAAGVREFGDRYRDAMSRAAEWLVTTQDADGCWRKHPTPFAAPGEKAYETHVAWGLLEAACVGEPRWAAAALANVRWALRSQHANGWFEKCCLESPAEPLTHTLGYALRGVVEAWRSTRDPELLRAARTTADGLLTALRPDGFLPGRLRSDWGAAVSWACLTGSVQVAHCWLMLYQDAGDVRYRDAGYAANGYVRRTLSVDGPPGVRGGVKGSFPVDGEYGGYQYLNWACKFFIDAHRLECEVRRTEGPA